MIDVNGSTPMPEILAPHLVKGYENFLKGRFERERERFRELAEKGRQDPQPRRACFNVGDGRLLALDEASGVFSSFMASVPPEAPAGAEF